MEPCRGVKVLSLLRVTASRICIPIMVPSEIAMNLLHGDHAIHRIESGHFIDAMLGSHDADTPCTILKKGWAYRSYNVLTIDVLGDSGSAE